MNRKTLIVLIASYLFGGHVAASAADVILLKDGTELVGNVTIQTKDRIWITLRDSGQRVEVAVTDIASHTVRKDPQPADPAKQPSVDLEKFKNIAYSGCRSCGGNGYQTCDQCFGTWRKTSIKVQCGQCKGQGTYRCLACGGQGVRRCTHCGGDGRIRKRTGYRRSGVFKFPTFSTVSCSDCGGAGKKRCPVCSAGRPGGISAPQANTFVTCGKCRGEKSLARIGQCPRCEGGYVSCTPCAVRRRYANSRPWGRRDFFDAFTQAAKDRAAYAAAALPEDRVLSSHEVPDRIVLWLEANEAYSDKPGYRSIADHRDAVIRLFATLQEHTRRDLHFYSPDVPFEFATRGSSDVFVLQGVLADFKLNLIQFPTPEQRARKVLEMLVSPMFSALDRALGGADVPYYGIVVSFGSENFLGGEVEKLEPEAVAVLVSAEACRRFARGRITFDELLKLSDCYIADRYRGLAAGLMKVDL